MELQVPYFRIPTQEQNWAKKSFVDSLRYGEPLMLAMISQMKLDVIFDRGYPAEWVYSRAYGRVTDDEMLKRVDQEFANLGAYVVVPLRRDYSKVHDHLVENKMLPVIHNLYLDFLKWTQCSTIVIYVDDFSNDLKTEIDLMKTSFEWEGDLSFKTAAVFTKEKTLIGFDNKNLIEQGSLSIASLDDLVMTTKKKGRTVK